MYVSVFHFLSLLNNISLYEYTMLFIHLSVDGHLDCFHFLGIMNNGAVNICVEVFCVDMFSIPLAM